MCVSNARNGAYHSWYTYYDWLDRIGHSFLFRLPSRILDALNNFGLRKVAICTDTDLLLTALVPLC